MINDEKRFAVLIDSENVSPKYIKAIMDEMMNYGVVTYKRIYGDWTNQALSSWKNIALENSITPIQQYSYTHGKNASDSAMIIDAMDILYSNHVEGFCLVSSDSDFTRLAVRLRESGMKVIGMGEKKTPKPFVAACNIFKNLEVISEYEADTAPKVIEKQPSVQKEKQNDKQKNASIKSIEAAKTAGATDLATIEAAIHRIIDEYGENNQVTIAELGNRLQNRYPDFDVRNYGFTKLSKFVSSINSIVVSQNGNIWYVSEESEHESESGGRIENTISYIMDMYGSNGIKLTDLKNRIVEYQNDFNPKDYGYSKLKTFISMFSWLRIEEDTVFRNE